MEKPLSELPDLTLAGFPFSERESEMLMLAAEGLTDKEIKSHLNLSESTIGTYWERIRKKVDARSRSEALAKAFKIAYTNAITQLAEAQQWIEIMVECTSDFAIFRTDTGGKILSWNPGVLHVLGYSEEEFLGENIAMVFTEEDRAAEMPEEERRVATERGRSLDNRWHITRTKEQIWVEGVLVALWREGQLFGFAKILQDRTEEMHAKQEVERLVKLHSEDKGH